MKIDTGHTGSEADDASSDNRPLKNPRELPQDTPPNWEELSGIATPEADYQLRHYTLKEYIQPKQPVRTLLGAILGGWDPMAVPVYPYLEQFGVEQFIRTRRIIWGLICEEDVQDDGVPPIATPFPLPLDLIHQSWVDITRAFASGHSRSTIGHLDKPHGRFEVTSVFLHDYIGLEHSILTHIDRALYRLMVETYSLGSSGTMRKILYTCVLKAVYEAPQGIVSFEPRAQVSNRIVEFIIASSYTNPLIPLVQYAVQIHDPEEPMIDGKVVAHHPFLSNEAQLRLAAARDRRDADYADAIVDRRPIRSARTRAIPDSPRSAGVASLIYPEPEMIRRAAAKAMDPINQRLSLIVPPTAVGGTCDPLRAAIIRLMPHDHSRGVHLQVQNDLRVEDWRAKVKTQRAAEAPAWTRGHVAKESMASSAPTVLNTPPAVRPERHVTWSPYVAEDARQVKRHAALAALAISQAAAHPNAMTGSTATPSHAADTDTLSSDFGKIGIRDMAQTLPTGLTTAFTTPPRQSGQIREETARRSPSQFALDLAVATVRMPKRAVELIGSIVVQTAEPVGRLALRQARRIAAPSSPSSSQMLLGVAVDQQSPPAADTDRPVIVLNDSPKMHYTARWLLMTRPGFSSPESPVPAVSLPIEELAYHAQRWLAERHVKDIFRRLWDVSPSACLMHLAIVDLIECRTFYQCIRTRDEVRVALDIALAEVMFGILRDAVRLPLSAAEDRIVGEFMSAFEDLPDHAFPKGRDWVLSELVDTRATWQALQSNIPDEDCTWIHAMPPPTPETDMTIQQVQQSLEELMVLVNHFTHADMPVVALGTLQRICFRLEALIVLNATDEGRATLEEFVRTEVICGPGSVTKAIVDCCACAQSFESVFGLMLLFATFATYAIQAYRSSSNVSGMFVTNIRDMETFRPSDIRDGNHHVPVHMDNAAMGRPKLAIARRAIDVSNEMNQDGAESGRSSRLNASDGESDGVRGVTGVRHVTGCVVAQTVPQVSVELAMRGLDDGEVYHRIIGGEGSSDEMMRSTLSKPDVMEQKRLELVMKKLREMRLDEHDEMAALPRAPSQPAVTVLESASLPITLDTATTVEQGCLERELVGVNAYPTAESDATSTSDDIGTRTPALTEDTASTLTETAGELSDEAGGHVAAEAAASQESTGSAPLSTDLSDVARSGQRARSTERQQQSAASVVTSEADLSPFQGDRSESLAEARPSIGGGTGWTGIASRSASAEDLTDPIGLVEALHLPPDCAATDEPQDGLGIRKNKSRHLDNRPDPVWSTLGRTGSGPMVETFFHATNQVHTTQPSGRRQMSADSERLIGHIAVRNAEKRQKGLCCGWTCWAK